MYRCATYAPVFTVPVNVADHEVQDSHQLVFKEVLEIVAFMDYALTQPGGSALLAGKSGFGRRLISAIVSHMHHMSYFTPKVTRGYNVKHFKNDLKSV